MPSWTTLLAPEIGIRLGWIGVLTGLLSGVALGLMPDAALGGYTSMPRRMLRLGHIACVALGILNIQAGLCVLQGLEVSALSRGMLAAGLIAMPAACWSSAFWRLNKHPLLFTIPSLTLVCGVIGCIVISF